MGTRATPRPAAGADRWFGIKTRIHAKLLTILTPEQLRSLNKDGVREQLGVSIERIVRDEGIPLDAVTVRITGYSYRTFLNYLGLPPVQMPNFMTSLPIESAGCDPEAGTCLP